MKNLLCLIILLFSYTGTLQAQDYPVSTSTQVIPPYSLYLPDYYSGGSEKLRVILLQRDLSQPGYDISLQMTLERNGTVIMRTSPSFHAHPITLSAGVPVIISGASLAEYFMADNILFSGGYSREEYERTRSLPEGSYRLTFQAYDIHRAGIQISNAIASVFFLQKSDPPLLNLPVCGSRIERRDPQFLTFSWSVRNTSQANTSYIFSLYEVKPAGSNPDYISRSTRAIYTTTTENTTILYGPAEPGLVDSMQYVWVVQAVDKEGKELYSNQGYSQRCTFTYLGVNPFEHVGKPVLYGMAQGGRQIRYNWPLAFVGEGFGGASASSSSSTLSSGSASSSASSSSLTSPSGSASSLASSSAPTSLSGSTSSASRTELSISSTSHPVDAYRLQYRAVATNNITYDWQTIEIPSDTAFLLTSLEPDREYEAHLQWKLSGVYSPFSDLLTIKTPPLQTVACGDLSILTLPSNKQVQPALMIGNIIRIGHYEVLLTSLSGGRIITPGLGFGLEVVFKNIVVNTDLVAISGEMHAITKGIDQFIKEELDAQHGGDDMGKVKTGDLVADITTHLHLFTKEAISVDTSAKTITLTDSEGGGTQTIHYTSLPLLLEDADGKIYQVTQQGGVNYVGHRDLALAANAAGFNNLQLNKGRVDFAPGGDNKYAFDTFNNDYPSAYESLANGQYHVNAKAIIPGIQETIIAHRSDTSAIIFINGKGVVYPSTCIGLDCKVTITGGPAGDAQELYALHTDGSSVGKLLIPCYPSLQKKAVLIPIGENIFLPEKNIAQTLASVYGSIGISYTLEIDNSFKNNKSWDLNKDGILQDSKSALLSNDFTGEERAMKKAYRKSHHLADDAVYLFMVNEVAREDAGLLGKMPRKSQFGFVFLKNGTNDEIARTVAHEIGHGAYTLEHTISGSSVVSTTAASNSSSNVSTGLGANSSSSVSTSSASGSSSNVSASSSSGLSFNVSASSSSGLSFNVSTSSSPGSSSNVSTSSSSGLSSNVSTNSSPGSSSEVSASSSSGLSSNVSTNPSPISSSNLMTTGAGLALHKFQWDIVHDPGSVWGLFEDDAASELTKGLSLYKCLQKDVQSACTSLSYYAPDSTIVTLPTGAIPLSVFYQDFSTSSPAMPGSLNSFEYKGKEYYAIYYVSNGRFKGYSYEKYDSSTYIYPQKKQADGNINIIKFDKEIYSCAVTVNGTSYPNTGCLCQNNLYTQHYKRFLKEVIDSDQPEVLAEIAAICKTIISLPTDVLSTNNELFTCYYNNPELYYVDWKESPKVFTLDQLKQMHTQLKELDSSINVLNHCEFATGSDLVKFINNQFIVKGSKTSYLTNAQFQGLSPETRACLIAKLLQDDSGQRWSITSSNFGGQNIMLEIFRNCANDAERYKVIKILEEQHLFYKFLADTYDYLFDGKGNFSQLCNAITTALLNEEKPANDLDLIRNLIAEKKFLIFDNGYFTASNQEAFSDKEQKILLEVKDGMGAYLSEILASLGGGGATFFADYGKATPFSGKFKPLEYLIIIPKRDINAFGRTLEQGIPYILPALSVYWLFKMDTKAAMETSASLMLNTGLCSIGMEGLSAAGTGASAVNRIWNLIDVSLTNFVTYANSAPELEQDNPQLVKYTNYLTLAYVVGTLTVGSVKAIRNARIAVPASMVEGLYKDMSLALQKIAVTLEEREVLKVKGILERLNDGRGYLLPYKIGDSYNAIINGEQVSLDLYSLKGFVNGVNASIGKEIVLFSNGDLLMAKRLSKVFDRSIVTNNGWVKFSDNSVIEAEHGFMRVTTDGRVENINLRIGKDVKPGNIVLTIGDTRTEEELAKDIFMNIKGKLKLVKDEDMWLSSRNIWEIVRRGKELKIANVEMEDVIFNACRRRDYRLEEVVEQLENWSNVRKRGYPYLFTNIDEFKKFGELLKEVAKEWGLPAEEIYVQGSALRMEKPQDLDITIRVGAEEFEEIRSRFKPSVKIENILRDFGVSGKISGNNLFIGNDNFTKKFLELIVQKNVGSLTTTNSINKIQISIVKEGTKIDTSPYLNL